MGRLRRFILPKTGVMDATRQAIQSLRICIAGPYRRLFPRQKPGNWEVYREAVEKKVGLEIGGPSRLWASGHFLPVYPIADYIDGVNFAEKTLWSGRMLAGRYQCEGGHGKGRQFINDAVDLSFAPDGHYDFVLSCHVLEHVANPVKALKEWERVLKHTGALIAVVPYRDGLLPLKRDITSLGHIIEDYAMDVGENDLSHLDEVVECNASLRSVSAREKGLLMLSHNFEHRMMHHHMFDPPLLVELVDYVGLQVEAVNLLPPYHIVCLARKVAGFQNNEEFLGASKEYSMVESFPKVFALKSKK